MIIGSFVGIIVEIGAINIPIIGSLRLKMYYWVRFLSRMAGRGMFYIALSLLCFTLDLSITTVSGF